MNILRIIGNENRSYEDRPTVKVALWRGNTILLLNNGLLPGGGVESSEEFSEAIHRELQEEIGISVSTLLPIGTVVQYRDFLQKKYIIHGYSAKLNGADLKRSPQDKGEEKMTMQWVSLTDAIKIINKEISKVDLELSNDSTQGRLYNLLTTKTFLRLQITEGLKK